MRSFFVRRRPAIAVTALAAAALACDPHSTSAPVGGVVAQPQAAADLFANAATSAAGIVRGKLDFTQFGLWGQQLATIDGSAVDRYGIDSTLIDASWNSLYAGPLQDIEQALAKSVAANDPHAVAPLLILRAWAYDYITRVWGDVPFSAANQANTGAFFPQYDRQPAVYDALLKDLAQAPSLINAPGAGGFGTSDPVYGGDSAKWRRFANALRARLALELLKADATRAKSELSAAIGAGGFLSNDDDAAIRWSGDGTNDNPWSAGAGAGSALRLSKTLIDTLANLADPRLPFYAQRSKLGGQYTGAPNGLLAPQAAQYADITSVVASGVARKDAPSVLMSFAEFSFIEAEAAERGWITGSAETFYAQGIRASMQKWGVAPTDIDTYLASARIKYAGGSAGLDQIALQEWIALFTQGIDAWSVWRRMGAPALSPVAAALTSPTVIPRRLPYPISELRLNANNVQRAIAAQDGAGLTDRVWLDK